MDFNALYLRHKFWINDYFSGSPIGKPYREIMFIQEHDVSQVEYIREQKLKRLLSYAKSNCPFYNSIPSSRLQDFPVVNKQILQEHYDLIKVDNNIIPGQKGEIHIQRTSGSTGTPFAVAQDTLKRARRIAELKYFGKIVGFRTHDKLIHLRAWNRWQSKTSTQIKKENIIPFDITSLNDERMEDLCRLINESKGICVRGYASTIDMLSRYAVANKKEFPHLKIIIAGGEALQDETRERIKKSIGCEIISQYADEECGILAQERTPTSHQNNKMYLNVSGYFFEFLKLNSDEMAAYGELGRIVLTDLHNFAFPIIRYDTGDTAMIGAPDEYSHGYPVIEKLYGRRLDLCFDTSGAILHPIAIGRIMKQFDNIRQWQFVQTGEKMYEIRLSVEKDVPDTETILAEMKNIIGYDANINFVQTDENTILASGKRKPVINEWKHV